LGKAQRRPEKIKITVQIGPRRGQITILRR
jgi:hypothetical protein